MLGEFEYLVIAATARLGQDAYGAVIRQAFEQATQRTCSIGALYTTLDRLESKGLVKTWLGDPTPERGGRARRMVRVTSEGVKAAKHFHDTILRATRGISWQAIETGAGR